MDGVCDRTLLRPLYKLLRSWRVVQRSGHVGSLADQRGLVCLSPLAPFLPGVGAGFGFHPGNSPHFKPTGMCLVPPQTPGFADEPAWFLNCECPATAVSRAEKTHSSLPQTPGDESGDFRIVQTLERSYGGCIPYHRTDPEGLGGPSIVRHIHISAAKVKYPYQKG